MKGTRELKQKGEKSHKNGPIVENNTVPNKRTNDVHLPAINLNI